MTTLLIVDDQANNRDYLVTLLRYAGYDTLESANGRSALALVRAHHPALVICDIVMPSMDGFEFVRQLRADADIAATKVVFYTAHYRSEEAETLAAAAGVARVLIKPAEPPAILALVAAELNAPAPKGAALPDSFPDDHLRLLSSKLAGATDELTAANNRLARLVALNLDLASEHVPETLLDKVCHGARSLLEARHAFLRVLERADEDGVHVAASGLDSRDVVRLRAAPRAGGLLERVQRERRLELGTSDGEAGDLGLPFGLPPMRRYVAAPIVSIARRYGWICVAEREDGQEFARADAEVLGILAAQVGRIYENGSLYRSVSRHATRLEQEVQRRTHAERRLAAQYAVSRVLAETHPEAVTAQLLLKTLCTEMQFVTGALWEVDRGVGALTKSAAWPDDRAWSAMQHAPTSSVALGVWREGAPCWVNDVQGLDAAGGMGRDTATGTALAFPVHLHGEIIGIIELRSQVARAAEPDLLASCQTIGTHIAQYLERRAQHRSIERLNRMHRVLSAVNSTIVRVHDRARLYAEFCRIAVALGGFDLAWVGEAQDDQAPRALAAAGPALARIESPESCETDADDANAGVVRRALVERRIVYANDVLKECAAGSPRYARALRHGYRAVIALPLLVGDVLHGCLALFAREPDVFNADELGLLEELAGDIAFALRFIGNSEELSYLASHDPLTGLLNRSAFLARLAPLLGAAIARGGRVALVVADLRRFRYLNESLGRAAGDTLLVELARRLQHGWPEPQYLARVGANAFAGVLLDPVDGGEVAGQVDGLLRAHRNDPFRVDGVAMEVGFAIGIALHPEDGDDAETLFQHAEAAMSVSRATGERYSFYQPDMTSRVAASMRLESRLRQALDAEQFLLHYQPKIDAASGATMGFEALLRWQDPERGLVPPGEFIPLLEESGMIVDVGLWVINRALEDERHLRALGMSPGRIAVNVSARQLQHPQFIDAVRRALRSSGGGAPALDFEITESMLMGDVDQSVEKLRALREMGIDIAIDDFGTGYSSLAYLARLPVNALKVDRSFVATMTESPESMAIVATTISLAHTLNLRVIAEGVETEEQAKLLRLVRCDQLQGYLFGRPRPLDALGPLLR
ncbi:MAG: EAL domain-containing protein [Gammaproteobacteria bacterium]